MRQFMMTVMALAVFGATVVTAQAENQTPNPRTVSGPVKKRTVSQTSRPSQAPTFAACQKKAHDLGVFPGQVGYVCYVTQCMGGAIDHVLTGRAPQDFSISGGMSKSCADLIGQRVPTNGVVRCAPL